MEKVYCIHVLCFYRRFLYMLLFVRKFHATTVYAWKKKRSLYAKLVWTLKLHFDTQNVSNVLRIYVTFFHAWFEISQFLLQPHVDFGLKVVGCDLMAIPGLYRFVQVQFFIQNKSGFMEICLCVPTMAHLLSL